MNLTFLIWRILSSWGLVKMTCDSLLRAQHRAQDLVLAADTVVMRQDWLFSVHP